MALAKLSIDLEARLGRLEQDMSRATKLMERSASQMERSYTAAAAKIGDAFKAISVAAVVTGLTAVTRNTIAGIDALNDMADATGSTVEKMSALEDVAARTGTNVDTVTGAVVKFNAQIQEALKPGTEAANVFKLLGLNAQELADIDPADALLKTAKALAQFADDGNKARVVQALFGKSVREVAPLLKDLAEAGSLNATVTAEQAKQAEKFNQNMAALQKNISDVARAVVSEMLPALNSLFERFKIAREQFGGLGGMVSAGLGQFARGESFDSPQKALEFYSGKLKEIDADIKRINENPDLFGGLGKLPQQREEVERLANAYRAMVNFGNAGQGRGVGPGGPMAGPPSIGRLPTTPKTGSTKAAQIPFAITDAREYYRSLFLLTEKEYEEAEKTTAKLLAELEKLRVENIGPAIIDQPERLRSEFLKAEKAGYDETEEAIRRQQTEVKKLDSFTVKFAENVQDTLGQGLYDAMNGNFKSIGDSFKAMLQRMAAEAIAANITRAIFGGADGKGGWLSALGGLFGGSSGGSSIGSWSGGGVDWASLAGWFAGFFADGGHIPAGKWGMTGEQGPEMVYGGRTGVTVQPMARGGMTVQQTFVLSGPVDRRTQSQVAAAAQRGLAVAGMRGN